MRERMPTSCLPPMPAALKHPAETMRANAPSRQVRMLKGICPGHARGKKAASKAMSKCPNTGKAALQTMRKDKGKSKDIDLGMATHCLRRAPWGKGHGRRP